MTKIAGLVALIVLASFATVRMLDRAGARQQTPDQPQAAGNAPRGMLVVPVDGRGHFVAEPLVNGVRIQAIVDTGATTVALSAEDAARAGIFPNAGDFRQPVATANGAVNAAPVRLREMRLGGILLRDVEAIVLPAGRLKGSLLGMSFLGRLSSFQVANGSLLLKQ